MEPYYDHGGITIYQGDCREILPSLEKVGFLVTDPPYGINLKSSRGGHHGGCKIKGDDSSLIRDEILELARFDGALVFGSWRIQRPARTKQIIIWCKGGNAGMGDLSIPWKPNHEEIYIIGGGFSGKRDSGVITISNEGECRGRVAIRKHPTEKPLELMRILVSKCPGSILDPFMGSGTTLRAAKDLGRKAIGIEIEEKYCEIAAKRLAQETLLGL